MEGSDQSVAVITVGISLNLTNLALLGRPESFVRKLLFNICVGGPRYLPPDLHPPLAGLQGPDPPVRATVRQVG